MHYKLILENHVDGLQQRSWSFRPPTVLGRDPGADLCIDHDSISRKHCQFSLNAEEALVIKDLESTNGIYVDDNRVHHAILMPGQTIQIGALIVSVDFSTEEEVHSSRKAKAQGSVYSTQPMETFRPVPLPPEKPWWRKILG